MELSDISLCEETKRKSIHLSVVILPVLYLSLLNREQMLLICVFISAGFLIADILRLKFDLAQKYFMLIFSSLLRGKEKSRGLTGATYLFLGITATVFFFPKESAVASLFIVTIADSAAAIFGKAKGKLKIFDKTIEGSIVFLVTSIVILFLIFGIHWELIIIAVILSLAEVLPLKINDNILIPLTSGLLLNLFKF